MGHAKVSLTTSPDDPGYLQLIEAEKAWLRANPLVADIYTFRSDDKGKIRLIVDSETDYDHNGVYGGEREQRTAIGEPYEEATDKFHRALRGSNEFEFDVMQDRWGIWVSSFTPIFDDDGRIEGAVGIDYPASDWIKAIAWVRWVSLASSLVVIAIVLLGVSSYTVIASEVQERRLAQTRLESAREATLVASAAKSEFLAVVGHEVRSPLAAINGCASMMSEGSLDNTQKRYLATISTAGQRLTELVNSLLDFTKIEDGNIVLTNQPWNPELAIQQVIEMMSTPATQKGLTLHFDSKLVSPLTLMGDAARLRQILLNLMSNAVKFTGHGSITIQAAWTPVGVQDEGNLVISVSDTGIGIPPENIPQIFHLFSLRDSRDASPNASRGVGLAITKRLIDMMGGTITARSSNRGSTFSFTIPCPQVKNLDLPVVSAPSVAHPLLITPATSLPLALIIDDDKLNRSLLKHIMQRQGYTVDLAVNGVEGLCMATETNYRIIFMDLEMPDLDGFLTAKKIRAGETSHQHVPIVAVTGLTEPGTRGKCLAAGMDGYITRPIFLPALTATLDDLLRSVPRVQYADKAQLTAAV